MQTKSPFVRYIVYFYGNLGIQLLPYNTISGKLNLLKNLIIIYLTRNAVFGNKVFKSESFLSFIRQEKPFFAIFFEAFSVHFFPIVSFVTIFSYILTGPRITQLLDSKLLRKPFEKRENAFFTLLFVGNFLVFIVINLSNVSAISGANNPLDVLSYLYILISLFSMSSTGYFHLFILHYTQYATLRNLKRIKFGVSQNISKTTEKSLIGQFIQLAVIYRELNTCISLPLFLMYIATSITSLVLFYFFLFIRHLYFILIPVLINLSYQVYLTDLNGQIRKISQEILELLNQTEERQPLKRFSSRKLSQSSRLIRHHELSLYRGYFQTKFFNIALFNRSFIFGTFLLTFNYIIFIYQT